ncbi:hypothetical protein PIB30_030908 [Stylosanthes scabra]|uniref:Uncharacterized protein n=1 Tax=Stylosanthes scabra TaxID=79078 RepID=A0ABU6YCC9_9FABA|nr:hypothetical protein [Stylosanthes scabra]
MVTGTTWHKRGHSGTLAWGRIKTTSCRHSPCHQAFAFWIHYNRRRFENPFFHIDPCFTPKITFCPSSAKTSKPRVLTLRSSKANRRGLRLDSEGAAGVIYWWWLWHLSDLSLHSKKMDELMVVPVFHVGGWMVKE